MDFFCKVCKIFKNTFFKENLWMTAFILQELQTLYLAITYSRQLSSSEKSLVEKKILFFIFFIFYHFLWQMPVYLVSYVKHMLHPEQPTVLLARRHLNIVILTNFKNLSSISNIF